MTFRKIIISESEGYDIEKIEHLLKAMDIDFRIEPDLRKAVDTDFRIEPEHFDQGPIVEDTGMVSPTMADSAQDQAIEPENIDKVPTQGYSTPFVRAQISTKNQMILRNILAATSSAAVLIVFILEKLGIL